MRRHNARCQKKNRDIIWPMNLDQTYLCLCVCAPSKSCDNLNSFLQNLCINVTIIKIFPTHKNMKMEYSLFAILCFIFGWSKQINESFHKLFMKWMKKRKRKSFTARVLFISLNLVWPLDCRHCCRFPITFCFDFLYYFIQ